MEFVFVILDFIVRGIINLFCFRRCPCFTCKSIMRRAPNSLVGVYYYLSSADYFALSINLDVMGRCFNYSAKC